MSRCSWVFAVSLLSGPCTTMVVNVCVGTIALEPYSYKVKKVSVKVTIHRNKPSWKVKDERNALLK